MTLKPTVKLWIKENPGKGRGSWDWGETVGEGFTSVLVTENIKFKSIKGYQHYEIHFIVMKQNMQWHALTVLAQKGFAHL